MHRLEVFGAGIGGPHMPESADAVSIGGNGLRR